ncbi:MAG: nicotinate-nucleotide adenylyltransferase [Clostridia bacterium]|nr:nicotinate-nucleotide adenylyltransferase [Clostridia bacterium]
MKVGIFGGSFNPVHNEHILIAERAIIELGLNALYVIPTFVAPHKKGEVVASGEDRLNMLKIAFLSNDKIIVSDYEIKKQGVSYTYLTIRHFKKLHEGAELYFLMGSDMLDNFSTWKNPREIVDNANIVLIERRNGNYNANKLITNFENTFKKPVTRLKVYGTTVSSTEVRLRVMLGLDTLSLILKEVANYIAKTNLYGDNPLYNRVKNALPEKRRVHTLGVILTACSLAEKLGVDKKKAELSALLHDLCKYSDISDFPSGTVPENAPSDVWHQYLSYYVAKNELGVTDEDVLNAILYHTTGRPNMSKLEKIIYIADLLEPSRTFKGVDELRNAISKDFNSGFLTCLIEIEDFLVKQGKPVFDLTRQAINYYKGENYELN